MKWTIAILLSAMVAVLVSQSVQAARIDPNKDTTIRGATNYNASSPFGLFVKNSSDVSYLEFDLGLASVTEAKLMLHNDDAGVTALWDIVVNAEEFTFDENLFTDSGLGTGWANVGTISGVMAIDFYELDVTAWYNANLGKTMSMYLGRDIQPSGSGPIFEDREGTKTGDALTFGPRLEVISGGGVVGDVNGDNLVDLDDLTIIRSNFFNTGVVLAEGDLNLDNIVNFTDYRIWSDNKTTNALSAASAVPEPGAMLLVLFGGAWLIRVRRLV